MRKSAARNQPSAPATPLQDIEVGSRALEDAFSRAGVPVENPAFDKLREAVTIAKDIAILKIDENRPSPQKIPATSLPSYLSFDANMLVVVELGADSLNPTSVGINLYSLKDSRIPVVAPLNLERQGSLDAWRQRAPGEGKAPAQSAALVIQPRLAESALAQPSVAQIASGRGTSTRALLSSLGSATRSLVSSNEALNFEAENAPTSIVVAWVLNNVDQALAPSYIKSKLLADALKIYKYRPIADLTNHIELPPSELSSQFQVECLLFGARGMR